MDRISLCSYCLKFSRTALTSSATSPSDPAVATSAPGPTSRRLRQSGHENVCRTGLHFDGYVTILPHPHGKQAAADVRWAAGAPRPPRIAAKGLGCCGARPARAWAQKGAQGFRRRSVPSGGIGRLRGGAIPPPSRCSHARSYFRARGQRGHGRTPRWPPPPLRQALHLVGETGYGGAGPNFGPLAAAPS
jgi:hypothetical protein